MIIVYILCGVCLFIVGVWSGYCIKRPKNELRKTREALERELKEFPPCLTCDHLKSWRPESNKYYTYCCDLMDKGFDIAPLYCKDHKEKEGAPVEQES